MREKQIHAEFRIVVMSGAIVIPSAFLLLARGPMGSMPFLPMMTGFGLWALSPFLMLCLLSFKIRTTASLVTAAAMMFGVEIYSNLAMHLAPHSAQSAWLFVRLPIYLLLVVMPVGLALGGIGKAVARRLGSMHPDPASDASD